MSEWTFNDEKNFVDNLGSFRGKDVSPEEYIRLLRQYLRCLDLRQDEPKWKEQIRKYVQQRIKVEEQCLTACLPQKK